MIYRLLILTVIFSSCGPGTKLRRAERLINKAEAMGATWRTDTVYREETITVMGVKTDTVFTPVGTDTVTIEKERLMVKFVQLPGKKVYIEGECAPDTITVEIPVTVTKTIQAPKQKGIWHYTHWFGIIAAGAFVCGLVVRSLWRT